MFTIGAFGNYEFQPNRGLYITKIEVSTGGAAAAPEFFAIPGHATGVSVAERQASDRVYYDLRGQRVANPTKGLYIVNGKKVIVK